MGSLNNRRQAGPTPYRVTEVVLDAAETSLSAPGFAETRFMGEIKPQYPSSHGVEQLASGVWILSPVNRLYSQALSLVSTGEPAAFGTLRKPVFNAASVVEEVAYWRTPSELAGIGTDASVATNGDYWMKKRVAATGSYNSSIPPTQNPLGQASFWPLDRVLEQASFSGGYSAYEAGYLLRFALDSSKTEHLDNLFVFYFGGEVDSSGRGQFALQVSGTGLASLWEIDSDGAWHLRDTWPICHQTDMPNSEHSIRILPHAFKWIEFEHRATQVVGGYSSLLSVTGSAPAIKQDSGKHLYTIRVPKERPDYSRWVTYPGPVRMDIARFCKLRFQINRLLFPVGTANKGVILDSPLDGGYNLDTSRVWQVRMHATVSSLYTDASAYGTNVSVTLKNSIDGTDLTPASESYTDVDGISVTVPAYDAGDPNATPVGFAPVGIGLNPISAEIDMWTLDSSYTPYFYGYSLRRNPTRPTVNNTEEVLAGNDVLREVSVMGPDADPSQESASVSIVDHTGKSLKLQQHADTPILVRVGYDKSDLTKKFNAFRGYVRQADRERRHTKGSGAFYGYASYDVSAYGMWRRVAEKWLMEIPNEGKGFLESPDGSLDGGLNQCYPYSYIIAWMLRYCGFDDGEVKVDSDFSTLRPVIGADKNGIEIARPLAQTPCDAYINYVLTNHVGGYLLWDHNAGSAGKGSWRLRMFPQWDATPVFNFVLAPAASGKLAHRLESYPANTSPISRRGYREWVVPPEGNLLWVVGQAGDLDPNTGKLKHTGWWVNERSVQVPGYAAPDPTDPDYIGRAKRLLWYDPYITNDNVLRMVGNRVAETAMRGYRMRTFTSHYVLINAPADLDQSGNSIYSAGRKRPLQFGDIVNVGGIAHMIRRVSPAWRHDTLQYAKYEVQELRAPIFTDAVGVRVGTHSVGASRHAFNMMTTWNAGLVMGCPNLFVSQKEYQQDVEKILALPTSPGSFSNAFHASAPTFTADVSTIDGGAPIQ